MWDRREPAVGKDLLVDDENLYFEINEDLNLNLKLNADHIQLERLDSLRKQIHDRLLRVDWPIGLGGATRDYKQTTYVLFEWDCGLVSEHSSVKRVAENLYTILEKAVSELG
jgi:hypothetical protein